MSTEWWPSGILGGAPKTSYGILILNQPVNKNALEAVINGASLVVCADAGADRLLDLQRRTDANLKLRAPDAIVGDLDSVTPDALKHYESRGVQIVRISDQYSTDFTKSLKWMRQKWTERMRDSGELDVVVLGGLGGRVDQGFSQIHHLYMACDNVELLQGRIYLLSEQSLTFVLSSGNNIIHIEDGFFEENVGIIPMLGRTLISTKGLEWDVKDWPTEFGDQLSTSNHIRSPTIEVSSKGTQPLFTLELAQHFASTGPRQDQQT